MHKIKRFTLLVLIILITAGIWAHANDNSESLNNGFQALFYHTVRIEESFPSLNPIATSLEEFGKALRQGKQAGEANLMIGLIYQYLNRPGTALGYYLSFAHLHPEESWINSLIGDLYFEMGRNEEAREFYEKALRWQEEGYSQSHFGLGRIALEQDDLLQAKHHFQLALENSENFFDARLALGRTLLHLEEYQKAIEVLELAQLQAPRQAAVHYYLSLSYEGEGREEQARHALKRYQELTAP
ncbi:MAG: tetratricopeptide repeat protein [Firmicutes bacterium]|nr:tetratricopeptide repeat protein [Bacillota bacterium]